MASSPLFKWLTGRKSRPSPSTPSGNPPSPTPDSSAAKSQLASPVPESFAPPQPQTSWNEIDPPRVAGFAFVPSPAPNYGSYAVSNYGVMAATFSSKPTGSTNPVDATERQPNVPTISSDGIEETSTLKIMTTQAPEPAPGDNTKSNPTPEELRKEIQELEAQIAASEELLASHKPRAVAPLSPAIMPPVDPPALQVRTPMKEVHDAPEFAIPKPTLPGPGNSKAVDATESKSTATNLEKPTCSLNMVCYRQGVTGCKLHQIQVTKRSRFTEDKDYEAALEETPGLITTDEKFFRALRTGYERNMCGFWRRLIFLKTLRRLRLLSYTENKRPTVVPLDDFVLQEILYAYNHPSEIDTEHVWIDWVFALRQRDKRHALEFVEGWNGTRIAILGMVPLIFSTLVGLIWSIRSGDWQTAFTVAGFILTAGTLLLALLAVVSGVEASGRASTS